MTKQKININKIKPQTHTQIHTYTDQADQGTLDMTSLVCMLPDNNSIIHISSDLREAREIEENIKKLSESYYIKFRKTSIAMAKFLIK